MMPRSRSVRRTLVPSLLALALSAGALVLGAGPASATLPGGPTAVTVDGQSADVHVTVDRSAQVFFSCGDVDGFSASGATVDDNGSPHPAIFDAGFSEKWFASFSPTLGQTSVAVTCEYELDGTPTPVSASVDLVVDKRSAVVTAGATGETGDVTADAGSTVRRSVTVIPESDYGYQERVPGGFVEFLVDGVVSGAPAVVSDAGLATTDLQVPGTPGTYFLTVRYLGDEAFTAISPDFGDVLTVPEAVTPIATTVQTAATISQPVATPLVVSAVVTPHDAHIVGTVTVRAGATVLGSAEVASDGSVSVPVGVLSIGNHTLTFTYAGDEHHAPSTATTTVTVAGEPVQVGQPNVGVALETPTPAVLVGGSVTLFGEDFDPGEPVAFFLHSDPVYLGTVVADAQGRARLVVTLPAGVPTGAHTVIATGGISGRWATTAITVSAPVPAAVPVVTGLVVPAQTTTAGSATLAATGAEPLGAAGAALALVLAGTGLVLRARRSATACD